MGDLPWRLVTFDIDGTLTTVHGWRSIAVAAGREAAYEESNRRFFARRSTEDEHLRELLELAEGLELRTLEGIVEATPKLSGLASGVKALKAAGATVALLTHNPAYVCDWYVRRFGFEDFEGCTTPPVVGGRIPSPGVVRADKQEGLRRLLLRHGNRASETAHVGDGWADVPVFGWVAGSVALNSRFPEVEAAARVAIRTTEFAPVLDALRTMAPRVPVNDVFAGGEALNT